jgi:type IV pilus assembly protein PilA
VHDVRARARRAEAGFTLIELMVVVLIIAILIAIAVPTFLGARERAHDSKTKEELRDGLIAAKVHYVDSRDFQTASAAVLEAIEPSIRFDVLANADTDTVGFAAESADRIVLARQSKSQTWYCLADDAGNTTRGKGSSLAAVDSVAECNGGW